MFIPKVKSVKVQADLSCTSAQDRMCPVVSFSLASCLWVDSIQCGTSRLTNLMTTTPAKNLLLLAAVERFTNHGK